MSTNSNHPIHQSVRPATLHMNRGPSKQTNFELFPAISCGDSQGQFVEWRVKNSHRQLINVCFSCSDFGFSHLFASFHFQKAIRCKCPIKIGFVCLEGPIHTLGKTREDFSKRSHKSSESFDYWSLRGACPRSQVSLIF